MSRSSAHDISAALLVLVVLLIMNARSKLFPSSQAVHWLGAALSGALLVSIGVWASVTVVGHIHSDGIGPASPVLVVIGIVEASSVRSPVSNTVNRLFTSFLLALNKSICMWALDATPLCLNVDLVGSAALVNVTINNVVAASIRAPLTLTVHRLAASTLGALLQLVLVWASIAIVGSSLANLVDTASLILMVYLIIVASIIVAPCSNTVHGLNALLSGALLKSIGVWAGVSIVSRWHRDQVIPASLVLVHFVKVVALSIFLPSSNTVHGLDAKLSAALNVAVSVWASITTVGSGSLNNIGAALLVLVRILIMNA